MKRNASDSEEALRSEFFKSDGEFVNKEENQEILQSTEEKLRSWRAKWEADLTRGSLTEFEKILSEISNRPSKQDRQMRARPAFTGFDKFNPLLGDSTPRGKYDEPQQTDSNFADDPFRPYKRRHVPANTNQRPSNADNRDIDQQPEKNPFEDDLASREERRASRQISRGDQQQHGSPVKGDVSPRRANESPRKKDSDLFGPGPDVRESEMEMRNKLAKAEHMKKNNYLRYRAVFGDSFMNSMLGGKTVGENTMGPRSPTKDINSGQSNEHLRTRYDDFHYQPSWSEQGKAVRNQ